MLSRSQRSRLKVKPARTFPKHLTKTLALGLCLTFPLSACSVSDTNDADAEGSTVERANTVTILGVVVGNQQAELEAALAPFEEQTGIEVIYEGTDAFTTLLPVRVDSGDSPDIAMFPQPGLMKSLAEEGALVPVTEVITREELATYYPESWIDIATVDEDIYGIWYRTAVKSLIWYVPEQFEKNGYDIPETWDEMMALSDQMVADGGHPWCFGMESGNASGWPGTDWVEEIMLRTAGPEKYDQWVENEIPFNSPEVKKSFEYFGELVRTPDYVWGGTVAALSIPWGDSPSGLFGESPDCFMHHQGNFITSFFPDDVELGKDVDFFPTPDIDPQYENSLLVAGDIFAMLNDTPEARQLMAYLATPTAHEIWAASGGFLSANKQVELNVYPDEVSRKQAELLTNAATVRFDGSDAMPGAVGTGTFWSGMMNFVAGSSAEDVTDNIEAYWPEDVEEESSSTADN
ncbi:MAG: ABC transporter substrate-binding protein [Cyanobacteria bacterium J06627_28]